MHRREIALFQRRQRVWSAVSQHPTATTRELARMAGLRGNNTVMMHLRFLRAAGYIDYQDGTDDARRIILPCGVQR